MHVPLHEHLGSTTLDMLNRSLQWCPKLMHLACDRMLLHH
nr:hypothetical protein Q903MT_gene2552 [Picea sitchensis]